MEKDDKQYHKNSNVLKAGTDIHGRNIVNADLYDFTAKQCGTSPDIVEAAFVFLSKFTVASIESNNYIDVIWPHFGKFHFDIRKLVKRERKKIAYSTDRFIAPISKQIIKELLDSNQIKRVGKHAFTTKDGIPITIPAIITVDRAIDLYKKEVLSMEYIEMLFKTKETALEKIRKEIKDYEYFKALRNDETL